MIAFLPILTPTYFFRIREIRKIFSGTLQTGDQNLPNKGKISEWRY